jgi:hypothetical protein
MTIRIPGVHPDAGSEATTGQGLDYCSFEHKHGAEFARSQPKLPVVFHLCSFSRPMNPVILNLDAITQPTQNSARNLTNH